MKNQIHKNILAFIAQFMPFDFLRCGQHYPPVLPFYHVVSDEPIDFINSYQIKTQAIFEKELDYLLSKYQAVDLATIISSAKKNQMHLSFDDGLEQCFSVIAPILKRKGIPATFFVSSAFVDNKAMFHRFKRAILEKKGLIAPGGKKYYLHEQQQLDDLAANHSICFSEYKPYMSVSQIKALHSDGFTIGAHSINHPEMWLLTPREQIEQIEQSMQWVIDHFNPEIRAFSFPFTDDRIEKHVFDAIKKNQMVDVTFGTAGLKYDSIPWHYQRIPLEYAYRQRIKKTMHFEYLYFHVRKLLSKNSVIRK